MSRLSAQGIPFRNYRKEDEFSATFSVSGKYISVIKKAALATQCDMEILSCCGLKPLLFRIKKRIVMIFLLMLLTLFSYLLQNRIWFLEVTGNALIHEDEILRLLDERNVRFGTAFDHIDMEFLRNEILGQIPELDYITINTNGGFAEVVVRERRQPPVSVSDIGPRNLLAARDGIVESVTVTEGTPLIAPGNIVTKGQILISGISDLERVTVLTGAEGEIIARTFPQCSALLEGNRPVKTYTGKEKHGISISFGKNTINFFKTSGISYDDYDKMTHRITLTLPGGYELPLALNVSVFREYTLEEQTLNKQEATLMMLQSLRLNVSKNMTAGEILQEKLSLSRKQGCYLLTGLMECREEIGRSVEIKD